MFDPTIEEDVEKIIRASDAALIDIDEDILHDITYTYPDFDLFNTPTCEDLQAHAERLQTELRILASGRPHPGTCSDLLAVMCFLSRQIRGLEADSYYIGSLHSTLEAKDDLIESLTGRDADEVLDDYLSGTEIAPL